MTPFPTHLLDPRPTADEELRFRGRAFLAAECRVAVGRAVLVRRHVGQSDAATRAELLGAIRPDPAACGPECACGYCAEASVSAIRQSLDLFIPPAPGEYPEETPP